MKAGISFILALLLAVVLVFAFWLHTSPPLGTRWTALDRSLQQIDLAGDPAAR